MSNVNNLSVNEAKTEISWNYSGDIVKVQDKNIGQVVEDKVHEKIVISLCDGKYPYLIRVFDFEGKQLKSFGEPKPFEFYYLKEHSIFGVSIVCTTDEPVDGRMDWQFEIDYERGELKRSAPSY